MSFLWNNSSSKTKKKSVPKNNVSAKQIEKLKEKILQITEQMEKMKIASTLQPSEDKPSTTTKKKSKKENIDISKNKAKKKAEEEKLKAKKKAEEEKLKAKKKAEAEKMKAKKIAEQEKEKAKKIAEQEKEKAKKIAEQEKEKAKKIADKKKKLQREEKAKEAKFTLKSKVSTDDYKNYELLDLATFEVPGDGGHTFRNKKSLDAAKKAVNKGYQYFGLRLKSVKNNENGIMLPEYKKTVKIRKKGTNQYKSEQKTIQTILYEVEKIKNDKSLTDSVKQKKLDALKKEYIGTKSYHLDNHLFHKKVNVKNTSLINDDQGNLVRRLNIDKKESEDMMNKIKNKAKSGLRSLGKKTDSSPPKYYHSKITQKLEDNHKEFVENKMFKV